MRPTLIVGVGEWGAQVATAFTRRVERRVGQLPVVRAVVIDTDEAEGEETGFSPKNLVSAELEQVRRLDAVQATQRTGWGVESGVGSGVVLVASLGDDKAGRTVFEVARLLRELSERDFAHRVALSAVLLLPREAGDKEATKSPGSANSLASPADRTPRLHDQHLCQGHRNEPAPSSVEAFRLPLKDDLLLLDEGCYLLNKVNADGLLVAAGGDQADMVANWLVLWVLTPLQAALDRMPPGEAGRHFDTFGLAAWEFPLEPLTAYLARRWQQEALGRLLAPAAGGQGAVVAFLERHGQAGVPWPRETPLRFRVAGDAWATPALDLVRTLRQEIDQAVETERARLNALVVQGEEPLGPLCSEVQVALTAEVDALLDGPGLGVAEEFLTTLGDTAQTRATRSEQEAGRCYTRVGELDEPADEAGRVLDDLTGRFPPCQLRTLLGLAFRPWRLLHLWLLYREIGRRSGVYLAYRQTQWLLRAEAGERTWQAAFYVRLAQAVRDEKEAVAQLRTRLEQLRDRMAPDPALEQPLAQCLEAAALPAGLADHFYRRVTGDGEAAPAGLLTLYGPLSRWMREGWEAETLRVILTEHAQEQFAFLSEVRLDELLAHTHSGAELRRRLAALVDAAAPWWAYDEPALSTEERAGLYRLLLIGLPDADSSLLVDLLPDRPPSCLSSCFSTGDRRQVVVAQVMQGFQIG